MAPPSRAHSALVELREDLVGDVFVPRDPGYDEARTVFNGMVDRRPAVIAQCVDEADVVRAVRFGRELDLKVAVRGGGHGVAGSAVADAALVVDLRRMNGVAVDPVAEAVRVQGGAVMSRLDRAAQAYGLATTGSRDSATGVCGFVLGGGSGWLERAFGAAVDNLVGVELVTADGERVHADADADPELFWALHGGGGNFGVVTALTLRLHDLPVFSAALLRYPAASGPDAVRAFREMIRTGPDQVGGAVLRTAAEGSPEYTVLVTHVGGEEGLRRAAGPLLALPHGAELAGPLPYGEVQGLLDLPGGLRNHWSAECLADLPDAAVDAWCGRVDPPVPAGSRDVLFPLGGAVASGPAEYPLAYRNAAWVVHPLGCWADPGDDERVIAWVRAVRAGVRPWSTGAVCLNLVGDEGPDRVRAGLGVGNALRLGKVKRRWDPDNVFRFNHNIRPL
ncbi:MAG: FAD-binding oxidoreductase [Streptomyces sp.]|uniref:FAD-binding oxidoreductase n=1 Tax=Streptomyces sp. TaxID=1931 RepID=UPI0025CCA46A|nr:FAD-binding oxidoreductase [Streptomyces sp.]MBW8793883.1 FAD-binding oxidoreductase [Streptomyces sp.]